MPRPRNNGIFDDIDARNRRIDSGYYARMPRDELHAALLNAVIPVDFGTAAYKRLFRGGRPLWQEGFAPLPVRGGMNRPIELAPGIGKGRTNQASQLALALALEKQGKIPAREPVEIPLGPHAAELARRRKPSARLSGR